MSRRSLALFAFALIVAGGSLSSLRVWWHEQWDQTQQSAIAPAAVEAAQSPAADWVAAELATTAAPEQDVFVSVCAPEALTSIEASAVGARLVAVEGEASDGGPAILWQKGPLTEETLGPGAPDNCLFFNGRGAVGGGRVELAWRPGTFDGLEALDVAVAVRHPLQWPDRTVLVLLMAGLALLLYAGQQTEASDERPWRPTHALIVMGVWFFSSAFLSLVGAGQGAVFLAGLLHVAAYVGACWVMAERVAPRKPLAALAFHRISPLAWSLSGAVGLGLAVAVSVLLLLVPQGESHMTQVLQTSGGLVSVLTLALISPWAEELLLRGVLYGALERRAGPAAAVVGSAAVFSLLHLGQHWGNLAPWVMLTATGLALSLVRWRTGSTLASTVTHFVYNLALALPVLWVG